MYIYLGKYYYYFDPPVLEDFFLYQYFLPAIPTNEPLNVSMREQRFSSPVFRPFLLNPCHESESSANWLTT